MQHRKEPGEAHQRLMSDLNAVLDRYEAQGLPAVERVAILAQAIGQQIVKVDGQQYGQREILQSVAANIEAGNRKATPPATGLIVS